MPGTVNPLFCDGFYFYSSMYDDAVIGEFYRKISAESYSRATAYQHGMIGRVRDQQTGKIVYPASCGNLVVDTKLNIKLGLPLGSYTVTIPRLIIPYFDKKRFIRKYGYDTCKIPIEDFYNEDKIFDKYPVVNIGPYRIMTNILFILNRDRTVTMAILEGEDQKPFSAKHLVDTLREDDTITIFMNEPSQMLKIRGNTKADNLFAEATPNTNNNPVEDYYLTIPYSESMLGSIAPQVQHDFYNSWDLVINATSSGHELFTPTVIVSLLGIDKVNDKITFLISEDSLNALRAQLNVSGFKFPFDCWFIERPNRRSISVYEYSPTNAPILNLNYNENPAGNINIEIYECDEHYHKGRRLYDPNLVQLYYPNIFDFSSLNVNHSDLLIEVIEYPSSYTNQVMHNSLQPLFDSLGQDFYTEFVVNNYDVALNGTRANIKHFAPQHFPISFEDYANSPYYQNIRGYLLDKVTKTLATDPWLISEYYQLINNKYPRIITTSGTPRKYGLTIDGNLQGEYSAATEVVEDTSVASQNADDILHFDEPHTYLMYRSNEQQVPAMLYFNGKYIKPTAVRFWSGMNYLFIPTRLIAQVKEDSIRTHDNADVVANGKKLMEQCAPVTLDFFPGCHNIINDVPQDSFTVETMEDKFKLFDGIDEKVSIQSLVFYNADTKEILYNWRDLFDIVLEVNAAEYTTGLGSELLKIEKSRSAKFLLTILNEIFCTHDMTQILVRADPDLISFDETIQQLIDSGAVTEDEALTLLDKKLTPGEFYLVPKDISAIGMTVTVVSTNYKTEVVMKGSSFSHIEGVGYTRSLAKANIDYFPGEDEHWRNYMVFRNGQYIAGATVVPDTNYDGRITINLPETANVDSMDSITYVHLPIRIVQEHFTLARSVRYMKPGRTDKASIATIWPQDDDYTNGIVFEAEWDREDNPMLPFEANENAKFTRNGFRLPPMSKSTFNARHVFYDADRTKYMSPSAKADINRGIGTVCALPCAVPIMRWEDTRAKDVLDIIW